MPELIVGKIAVNKVDKSRLFKGQNNTFLDIVLIPSPNSQYGDDYMIVQGVSKEEKEKGVRGAILGNAKFLKKKEAQAPSPVAAEGDDDGSQIPF